jgi:hypothetical protein
VFLYKISKKRSNLPFKGKYAEKRPRPQPYMIAPCIYDNGQLYMPVNPPNRHHKFVQNSMVKSIIAAKNGTRNRRGVRPEDGLEMTGRNSDFESQSNYAGNVMAAHRADQGFSGDGLLEFKGEKNPYLDDQSLETENL